MSGKISVKVRPARSKDRRYDFYLEWYLEVEGENGGKVTLSPGYPMVRQMLR